VKFGYLKHSLRVLENKALWGIFGAAQEVVIRTEKTA
jgi:hypothetical protein